MIKHLLYLHGFRSSPQSYKAQFLSKLFAVRYPLVQWTCPQLPPSPQEAADLILTLTQGWSSDSSAVIGSSLGGFYADWLARTKGFKSVLINPATDPARDLEHYIGQQTSWQIPNESFYFKEQYLTELTSLYPLKTSEPLNARQLLMACTGDEVLNWQEMVSAHPEAVHHIVSGSDHAMSDFDQHVGVLLDFLEL